MKANIKNIVTSKLLIIMIGLLLLGIVVANILVDANAANNEIDYVNDVVIMDDPNSSNDENSFTIFNDYIDNTGDSKVWTYDLATETGGGGNTNNKKLGEISSDNKKHDILIIKQSDYYVTLEGPDGAINSNSWSSEPGWFDISNVDESCDENPNQVTTDLNDDYYNCNPRPQRSNTYALNPEVTTSEVLNAAQQAGTPYAYVIHGAGVVLKDDVFVSVDLRIEITDINYDSYKGSTSDGSGQNYKYQNINILTSSYQFTAENGTVYNGEYPAHPYPTKTASAQLKIATPQNSFGRSSNLFNMDTIFIDYVNTNMNFVYSESGELVENPFSYLANDLDSTATISMNDNDVDYVLTNTCSENSISKDIYGNVIDPNGVIDLSTNFDSNTYKCDDFSYDLMKAENYDSTVPTSNYVLYSSLWHTGTNDNKKVSERMVVYKKNGVYTIADGWLVNANGTAGDRALNGSVDEVKNPNGVDWYDQGTGSQVEVHTTSGNISTAFGYENNYFNIQRSQVNSETGAYINGVSNSNTISFSNIAYSVNTFNKFAFDQGVIESSNDNDDTNNISYRDNSVVNNEKVNYNLIFEVYGAVDIPSGLEINDSLGAEFDDTNYNIIVSSADTSNVISAREQCGEDDFVNCSAILDIEKTTLTQGVDYDIVIDNNTGKFSITMLRETKSMESIIISYDTIVKDVSIEDDLVVSNYANVTCPDDSENSCETLDAIIDIDKGVIDLDVSKDHSEISGNENDLVNNDESFTYTIKTKNSSSLTQDYEGNTGTATSSAYFVDVTDSSIAEELIIDDSSIIVKSKDIDGNVSELIEGTDYTNNSDIDNNLISINVNEIKIDEEISISFSVTATNITEPDQVLENTVNVNVEDSLNTCIDENELLINCEPISDRDEITTEFSDTKIKKGISSESGSIDGVIEPGEKITYKITVTNETMTDAEDIIVRDSMLEVLPANVTYNDDLEVIGSTYSGDIKIGSLVLDKVDAEGEVNLIYSITINYIAENDIGITNYATDNGDDPLDPDNDSSTDEACIPDDIDCSLVTIVNPGNIIVTKSVEDTTSDNKVQVGEELKYSISVTNPNDYDLSDVEVKDTLSDATQLDVNSINNLSVNGKSIEGDITSGISINVSANSTAVVSFNITTKETLTDTSNIINTAQVIDPLHPQDIYYPSTSIPVTTKAIITSEKKVVDENNDGIAQKGEKLSYTIILKNESLVDVNGVFVQDTLDEANELDVSTITNLKVNGEIFKGDITTGINVDVKSKNNTKVTFDIKVLADTKVDDIVNIATVIDPNNPNDVMYPEAKIPMEDSQSTFEKIIASTGFKTFSITIGALVVIIIGVILLKKYKLRG